jgi:hypothetical protein
MKNVERKVFFNDRNINLFTKYILSVPSQIEKWDNGVKRMPVFKNPQEFNFISE